MRKEYTGIWGLYTCSRGTTLFKGNLNIGQVLYPVFSSLSLSVLKGMENLTERETPISMSRSQIGIMSSLRLNKPVIIGTNYQSLFSILISNHLISNV